MENFLFNNDGKLYICYIFKRRYPVIKNNSSVLFIDCIKINWKKSYVNGLCISIFLNKKGWYLDVIRPTGVF